jgi:hypothetical protein
MAIRQVRLPDPAGTPRVTVAESPAPTTPQPTPGEAPPPRRPEASPPSTPAAPPAPALPPAAAAGAWYRSEAWLVVELAAVVPVLVALVAPEAFRVWLVALGGVLIASGLVMLILRDRDGHRTADGSGGAAPRAPAPPRR